MAKTTSPLLPVTKHRLEAFGERLRLARLRRRLQAKLVAERAGMSTMTLRAVERGSPGVTLGAYMAVLQVLQLEEDIDLLGKEDSMGRRMQDTQMPPVLRIRRTRNVPTGKAEIKGSQPTLQVGLKAAATGQSVTSQALQGLLKIPPKPGRKG